MIVTKTFRFRIYPTKEQAVLLAKHFGAKRFVFNYFLDQRKSLYLENKQSLNYYDNAKALTDLKKQDEYSWMKEINSQTLQSALRDLDTAYNRFFRKQSRFPRFKSKHDRQSFRIPQFAEYEAGKLWIPKCKTPIKCKEDRPLTGKILYATICKKSTGKYFVSITVETEHTPYEKTGKQVGIDLGVKTLVVCSDGKTYPNIKAFKQYQKKLAYEQRQLAKKEKGKNSRKRQRFNVAKVYEKMTNIRLNHLHQISSILVRENQTICLEDLSVIKMMKGDQPRNIADACWGELIRQITYKGEWNEREVIKIDRYFPSSKMCRHCKFINDGLTLKDRVWTCPQCGRVLDRDGNAAGNILDEGLSIHSVCGTQSELKQKREKASAMAESMNHETAGSLALR
jgi:putative transposase